MSSFKHRCLEFLADSDFHGIRYITHSSLGGGRRLLWFFLFLASTITMVWFITSRCQYYLSYPYAVKASSQISLISLPALRICPFRPAHVVGNTVDVSLWREATLTDFLLLLHHAAGLDLTTPTSTPAELAVNMEKVEEWRRRLNDSTGMDDLDWLDRPFDFYDESEMVEIRRKLGMLTNQVKIVMEEDYLKFIKTYGVRVDRNVEGCAWFRDGTTRIDCKPLLRQVITDMGACLELSGDEMGRALTYYLDGVSSRQSKIILILRNMFVFYTYIFDVEDGNLVKNGLNKLRKGRPLDGGQRYDIYLRLVYREKRLSRPYHKQVCFEQRRFHCLQACISASMNCSMFFMPRGDAVMCPIPDQLATSSQYKLVSSMCDHQCPVSCEVTRLRVAYSKAPGSKVLPPGKVELSIRPHPDIWSSSNEEEAIYTSGSLMAEIGGTIGLFIGASVLTISHLVEFIIISVCQLRCRSKSDQH